MNRWLTWINLGGVGMLALLCALQWQVNRSLHLRLIDLETLQIEQTKALSNKDNTIQGNIADMNDFRERLARSDTTLKGAQGTIKIDDAKAAELSSQINQLQAAEDALKTSLDQWKAAVATRDDALQKADDQARKLAADRNDSVAKFNDLAARYNAAEDQLNQAAEQLKKLAADRTDAVSKFNDLANKYNGLVKEMNAAATKP